MNLKRHLFSLLIITALTVCIIAGCSKKDAAQNATVQKSSNEADLNKSDADYLEAGKTSSESDQALTKITLNEVAHSIFYAPMYAAIENGYFEQEGIDLDLVTGFGADKVMAAVLSEEADIGFMGPETTVYTYNEGSADAIVNFAQLTQRAGNFIVAREQKDDFTLADLKGAEVLGGRAGGMPEMVFEYVLKKNGIQPSEVKIDQSIDFGSTAAAFSGGKGAYTVEFEPSATALEQAGDGFVVSSVGVESGYVPYTAFSAKQSYLDNHKDLIQSFTNALQKGMDYVTSHSGKEIADAIKNQFSETDLETLTMIVDRYHEQDTWKDDLVFSQESFDLLLNILEDAEVITKRAPYEKLVTTTFAENAKTK